MIGRGINSIELFWDGKRWWIAGAIWTDETKANPIPKEYLPKYRATQGRALTVEDPRRTSNC